jgi:tetratricopeptide (TPR) repeat protein
VLFDRFRRERQILSRLEHPNIARLYDGGTMANGTPFLVMEYVQGTPLARYCDEQQLSVRDRVALFRKVCDAVSGAHRSLVIHRDIKPDNILVTPDGVPKLLDFGIGKLLETGTPDANEELTMTAERVGTPAWSSPEQITGGPIGVGTDIYSLGVVLYRLLTGYRPYQTESITWENAHSSICQRDPLPAGEALASKPKSREEAVQTAAARGTTPEALRKQLSGDLNNILLYSLRKEPDRRYRSVDQFNDELGRWLEGRAVVAAGDTMIYLAGKFIRRHRVAVSVVATFTILLLVSTFAAVREARRLGRRITADRALASSFLSDIHDEIAELPGSIPARETLLRKSLDYLNGLARDAGENEDTRRNLATAEENFATLLGSTGKYADGRKAWETANQIREALHAASPRNPERKVELVDNYLIGAQVLGRAVKAEDLEPLLRNAVTLSEQLVSEFPNNTEYLVLAARSYGTFASTLNVAGRSSDALVWLRKAIPIQEKLAADPSNQERRHELANLHYRMGVTQAQNEKPTEALPELDEALRIQTDLLRSDKSTLLRFEIASTHHFEGVALGQMGRNDEALNHFAQAIAIREQDMASNERDLRTRNMLAGNYLERSTVLVQKRQFADALSSINRSVLLYRQVLAADRKGVPARINLANGLSRLAQISDTAGDHQQALDAWRAAAALYDDLERDGFLTVPDVRRDAEHARRMTGR